MDKIIASTIARIKKENIRPVSRAKVLAKEYGLWSLFILALILGGFSLSAAHYLISDLDWDIYRYGGKNFLYAVVRLVPYFWTVVLALFFLAAFLDLRQTRRGYRYSRSKIFIVILGTLLTLGFILVSADFGKKFHEALSDRVPYYGRHLVTTKEDQWSQAEKGFLSGTILSVSDIQLEITDFKNRRWTISLDEKTSVRPAVKMSAGEKIKIIGELESAENFRALEIRPWEGPGHGRMGRGKNNRRPPNQIY